MVRISYNKANMHCNGPVRLMPGINRIADDAYEAIRNTPGWLDRVANGTIVVLESKKVEAISDVREGAATEGGNIGDVLTLLEDIPHMADVRDLRELLGHPDAAVVRTAQIRLAEIDAAQRNAEIEEAARLEAADAQAKADAAASKKSEADAKKAADAQAKADADKKK